MAVDFDQALAVARAARDAGAKRVALLTAPDADRGDVRAMAEGLATGAWRLDAFRSKPAKGKRASGNPAKRAAGESAAVDAAPAAEFDPASFDLSSLPSEMRDLLK